ncbi:hypothetical protein GGU10DRAFT_356631 [Lentinula aff. detonsa]|uniref:Uncharacterized protein n=1 Tax=Lentinula aff. detonsa TaxID=2804958 RepID=A0AA38KRQ7_9AGAR|nr:hypothetical protein GGU10DRAFT_356631 [Lentinula aff. detonsa]
MEIKSKLSKSHSVHGHDSDSDNIEAIEFPSPPTSTFPSISPIHSSPLPSPSFELKQGSVPDTVNSSDAANDHETITPTIIVYGTDSELAILPAQKETTGSLSLIKSIAKKASMKRLRSISGTFHHHNHTRDSSDASLSSSNSLTSSTSSSSLCTTSATSTTSASTTSSSPTHHRTRLPSLPSFRRRTSRIRHGSEQSHDDDPSEDLAPDTYYDGYTVPPSQRSFEVLSRPRPTPSQIAVATVKKDVKRDPHDSVTTPVPDHSVLCCRCGSEVRGDATLEGSEESLRSIDSDLDRLTTKDVHPRIGVVFQDGKPAACYEFPITPDGHGLTHDDSSSSLTSSSNAMRATKVAMKDEEVLKQSVKMGMKKDTPVIQGTNQDASGNVVNSSLTTDIASIQSTPQNAKSTSIYPPSDEEILPPFLVGPYLLDEVAIPILSGNRPLSFFFCHFLWGSLWKEMWYALTRRLQIYVRRRISVFLTWWLSRVSLSFLRRTSSEAFRR